MATVFFDYLYALWGYWWLLVMGIAMPVPDLYQWLHPGGKEFVVPYKIRLSIALLAVVLAQFLAYRDANRNLSLVIDEKRAFSIDNNALGRANGELERKLASLEQELHDARLAATLAPPAIEQRPPYSEDQQRATIQRELGALLSEGRKLADCYKAPAGRVATENEKHELESWEQRAYGRLAASVNPNMLSTFTRANENVSVANGQENWLRTFCWATRQHVDALEQIMAQEFSPKLSEAERQRRATAQVEIGKVLGEGQRLYNEKCATSQENPQTISGTEAALSAISEWEGRALSVVAGNVGPRSMEEWEQAENELPGRQANLQQRCQQLNARLFALRNIVRLAGK